MIPSNGRETIALLRQSGIRHVVMLTGDEAAAAERGLGAVHADSLGVAGLAHSVGRGCRRCRFHHRRRGLGRADRDRAPTEESAEPERGAVGHLKVLRV